MVHDFDIAMFRIGPFTAYWYGAVYSVGFLGILLWFLARRDRVGLDRRGAAELTILTAAAILVGGRVFDILVYERDFYRASPWLAADFWQGGMASHGVLLGALAAMVGYGWARGLRPLALLDEVVVPGAFLLAVGRLGNFIEGGVIGRVTSMPWGVTYADLVGPRHPVALYDGLKNLLLVPVLIWALRRWPAGRGVTLGLFMLLYGGLRYLVDLFRDYESTLLGMGPGQVFNLALALAGLVLVLLFLRLNLPPARASVPPGRPVGWLRAGLLALLVLYPLGIPTSWTRVNIEEKRQEALPKASP